MTTQLPVEASVDGGARPAVAGASRRASLPWGTWAASLGVLIILVGVWDLLTRWETIDPIIVPTPWSVADATWTLMGEGFFYRHLWVTTAEVLLGFGIGVFLGCGLGIVLGLSDRTRRVMSPYVVAFAGLPKVVLAPLFITAFGFGMSSKVVMAVTICFFALLVNTQLGLTSVDPEARRLMASLNASRRDVFFKLSVPHSLPLVFAGMKTALSLALVGAIVGEFVGASSGLGYLLSQYSYQLAVPLVWSITFVLALMGIVLYVMIEWLDRKIVHWAQPQGRGSE